MFLIICLGFVKILNYCSLCVNLSKGCVIAFILIDLKIYESFKDIQRARDDEKKKIRRLRSNQNGRP